MDEHERDHPAVDEVPRQVAANVDPRRYYVIIGALVVVIVLLAVRPWDLAGPSTASTATPLGSGAAVPATTPGSATTSSPSPAPTGLLAELQVTCGWPSGWRAASLQSWPGRDQPVRSWMAIDPVEATGPTDPAIPFAQLFVDAVPAIGFCAPLGEQQPPGGAFGYLYALKAGAATLLAPVAIEPSADTPLGVLWAPGETMDGLDPRGTWPPGSYVIELASENGDYRRYLGIEVHDLALRSGPPASSPSPVPSPSQTD